MNNLRVLVTVNSALKEVSLDEVAEFRNGKAISHLEYTTNGKFEVFGSNGPIARANKALYSQPAIVIGRVGAYCGSIHLAKNSSWITDNAIVALPKNGYDLRYLYYLLNSLDLRRTAIGSAQPLMTQSGLKVVRVNVLPLAEQVHLASMLSAIDEKIELNERMAVLLEAVARALFENWMHSAEHEIKQCTVQHLIDERVLLIGDGYRAKSSEFAPGGLPFVRAGNLRSDGLDLAGAEILSSSSVLAAGHKVGMAGDVAFTSKGTVGRITRVATNTGAFVYSPQVCFWRSVNLPRLNPHVLYRWMCSDAFNRQVAKVSTQTDMAPYVSLQDQRKMIIGLPSADSQHRFAKQLQPIDDLISANGEQSRTLATLRNTLLPKFLSGELGIPRQQLTNK